MKSNHNKIIQLLVCSLLFIVVSSQTILAQPMPPDDEIPIDGGLTFLSLAGVAYGVKKIVENRKNKSA